MRAARALAVGAVVVLATFAGGRSASPGETSGSPGKTSGTSVSLVGSARAAVSGVDITYTKKTVVVPAATVAQQLVGVSADGSTYTFKSAVGTLALLKAGKVMLLQGKAVADVTGVATTGGHLVVHTTPPQLTDFIQSGTVDVDTPVTFADASVTPVVEPAARITTTASRTGASAQGTELTSAPRAADPTGRVASSAVPRALQGDQGSTYSGTTGGIHYKATVSRATDRLDFTADYTYDTDGFIAMIETSGYLDTFAAHLRMLINDDLTKSSSFLAQPLDGQLKMSWSLARGPDAKETIKAPAFTLPFSFDFPFIIGGLPFFVKIQFQLLFTVALTAKNSTMEGGVVLDYAGSGGGLSASGGFSPQGSEDVKGSFMTPPSVTPLASGAVIAVDAPKIIFGIGLPAGLSGYGYIDMISSLGETTGSLIAGQSCERDDLEFTVKVGVGAEFIASIPEAALPNKVVYDKKASYSQPGCGTGH